MKRALVLSGGSIKGAFQAGAIAEILDGGFVPNAIYGISVGSLNGAFMTDRAGRAVRAKRKVNWPAIGKQLEDFWKKKIKSFNAIGKKRGGAGLLLNVVFNNFDGVIDTGKLRKLIYKEIDEENLYNSPASFSAGVVNLATGDFVNADLGYPNIIEYIIGSTAIPIVMPVTMLAEQPLVDGGLRDVTTLKAAIEDGADEITCVVCQARKVLGKNFDRENMLQLADRIMDIATNEIVNNDLEWAQFINTFCPKDGTPVVDGPLAGYRYIPITVIRPAVEPAIKLDDFKEEEIAELLNLGHIAAKNAMRDRPARPETP
ncbi:MAG: patatin-like phospholipase family protein [Candidatus Zixiibacteriota bacterium]|nr:MAG: patatin-like phospholipase family protein [candidate division Zixibacteria bacterium]